VAQPASECEARKCFRRRGDGNGARTALNFRACWREFGTDRQHLHVLQQKRALAPISLSLTDATPLSVYRVRQCHKDVYPVPSLEEATDNVFLGDTNGESALPFGNKRRDTGCRRICTQIVLKDNLGGADIDGRDTTDDGRRV
jgi:hypothetical protein